MVKFKTVMIVFALLALVGCGDVSVTATSDSTSDSKSDSTSDSKSDSTSEIPYIEPVQCVRCDADAAAAELAERMLETVNQLIYDRRDAGDIAVSVAIYNDLYTESMARLEEGEDVQTVEAEFNAALDHGEETA